MGQKVNPHGARVGVILDWSTKWYAGKKDFSNNLIEDYNLRKLLKEKLNTAGISRIDIQRTGAKLHVSVYTAKPGIVIGKGGAGVEALKKELEKFTGRQVALDILEIKNPDKTRWESFCGKYEHPEDFDLIIDEVFLKDGELYANAIDDDGDSLTFKLYPIGEDEFGRKGGMLDLKFGDGCLMIDELTCKKL